METKNRAKKESGLTSVRCPETRECENKKLFVNNKLKKETICRCCVYNLCKELSLTQNKSSKARKSNFKVYYENVKVS